MAPGVLLLEMQGPSRLIIVTNSSTEPKFKPDDEIDLRGVICPYNFVKTKIKLESMDTGKVLAVLLDSGDPIQNVPRSIQNEGHQLLEQVGIGDFFRILIRKSSKTR